VAQIFADNVAEQDNKMKTAIKNNKSHTSLYAV